MMTSTIVECTTNMMNETEDDLIDYGLALDELLFRVYLVLDL